MTEVREALDRLGLVEYAEAFISEGFDTWNTLCEIRESDLKDLNVKLGHRRKLQRAISLSQSDNKTTPHSGADLNNASSSSTTIPTASDGNADESPHKEHVSAGGQSTGGTKPKRKYRRHPKQPDPNAPERPASAYVIFSNHMREQLKSHDLTFTEMAKAVGEKWQLLPVESREQYEHQANAAKQKYNEELAEHKKTESYAEYQKYLADFKSRNAQQNTDNNPVEGERVASAGASFRSLGKRTKLESEPSIETQSSGHSSVDTPAVQLGTAPVEGSFAHPDARPRGFSSSSMSMGGISPPLGKDSYPSYAASSESTSTGWLSDHSVANSNQTQRRYSRYEPPFQMDLISGQYRSMGEASPTPTPFLQRGVNVSVERVQPQYSHGSNQPEIRSSAASHTTFHSMIEDMPPSKRVLPSPVPSTASTSPTTESWPPGARASPSNTSTEDPRQSAPLAALLRAGEIARQADESKRRK